MSSPTSSAGRQALEKELMRILLSLSKVQYPNAYYLGQIGKLTDNEIFQYISAHNKLQVTSLIETSPTNKTSKKRKHSNLTKGLCFISIISLTPSADDFQSFLGQLKFQLKLCREKTEIEELNLEVPSMAGVDLKNEDALKKYFNNIEGSIRATNSLSAYFHFLKGMKIFDFLKPFSLSTGELFAMVLPSNNECPDTFFRRVFNVAKVTAMRHIEYYKFVLSYPALLSCDFDFSTIAHWRPKLKTEMRKDKELRELMATTSSISRTIRFPATDIRIQALDPLPSDMEEEEDDEEEEGSIDEEQ